MKMSYKPDFCILCEREMHTNTKPFWVIDPISLEVKGLAHKSCRDKLRGLDYEFTTGVAFWAKGGPVSRPPSPEVIEFTARMIRYRTRLPQWETDVDFKVLILLYQAFEATNVEEFLAGKQRQELFAWWTDGRNEGHMTSEDLEEVKRRLRENLGG